MSFHVILNEVKDLIEILRSTQNDTMQIHPLSRLFAYLKHLRAERADRYDRCAS